jgi:chromosome partitioning protein
MTVELHNLGHIEVTMKKLGKIIAVANQKGGVGKTTTSVNLAASLAHEGKSILLVDSDPQGNATSAVGINIRNLRSHLYHAYLGTSSVSDILLETGISNLKVLPASIDLVAAEIELISVEKRERYLSNILKTIRSEFEYLIIDCPPSLGLLTVNALTAADSVLIPMQCEYFAMEGLAQLVSTIRSVKRSFNAALFIEGLLLTMFDKRNKLTYQVADEIHKHFEKQVFKTVIPRNVRLSECPSHGKAITEYDPLSSGGKAYSSLASEFLTQQR